MVICIEQFNCIFGEFYRNQTKPGLSPFNNCILIDDYFFCKKWHFRLFRSIIFSPFTIAKFVVKSPLKILALCHIYRKKYNYCWLFLVHCHGNISVVCCAGVSVCAGNWIKSNHGSRPLSPPSISPPNFPKLKPFTYFARLKKNSCLLESVIVSLGYSGLFWRFLS